MRRHWFKEMVLLWVALACSVVPTAQAPPQRIISLIPAVTEMLFAIGAGNQVVGVSSFDTFPAEVAGRTKVGGLFDPNYEAILALRPDLVVVYGSQDELIARLADTSVSTFVYRHGGLAHIGDTVRELGRRTGRSAAADALALRIEREVNDVRQRAAGKPRPRTLLVIGREDGSMRGLFVSGGRGFLHDLLTAAGGDNVMADVDREGLQLSAEQLLVRAPDVVIELRAGVEWSADRLKRERDLWLQARIPASRNGRIHILTNPALVIPGPRVGAAARTFADVVFLQSR
jgi:iron complex transport system substrate-binding protein